MVKVLVHVAGELSGTFELSRVPVGGELIAYNERIWKVNTVIHQPFVQEGGCAAAIFASISNELPGYDLIESVFIPAQPSA